VRGLCVRLAADGRFVIPVGNGKAGHGNVDHLAAVKAEQLREFGRSVWKSLGIFRISHC
jgi:hypothetical protein